MRFPDHTGGDDDTHVVGCIPHNMDQHARKAKIVLWLGRFVLARRLVAVSMVWSHYLQ